MGVTFSDKAKQARSCHYRIYLVSCHKKELFLELSQAMKNELLMIMFNTNGEVNKLVNEQNAWLASNEGVTVRLVELHTDNSL